MTDAGLGLYIDQIPLVSSEHNHLTVNEIPMEDITNSLHLNSVRMKIYIFVYIILRNHRAKLPLQAKKTIRKHHLPVEEGKGEFIKVPLKFIRNKVRSKKHIKHLFMQHGIRIAIIIIF